MSVFMWTEKFKARGSRKFSILFVLKRINYAEKL